MLRLRAIKKPLRIHKLRVCSPERSNYASLAYRRRLVANLATDSPATVEPAPNFEPATDEPMYIAAPANADNLSTASWLASVVEEPTVIMIRLEVEAKLSREREKPFFLQFV